MQNALQVGARLTEEGAEGAHLQQQHNGGNAQHQQRVNGPLGYHRTQGLRKRHTIIAVQYAATRKLPYSGNNQRCCIRQEDAVDADRHTRFFSYRLQRLPPAPAAEHLCHDAKGKRQQHPRPIHLVRHDVTYLLPILAAIHPIEYRCTEHQRHQYFQYDTSNLHNCLQR